MISLSDKNLNYVAKPDILYAGGKSSKFNVAVLISVIFTIALILVLIFGLIMGFLLAKCCLKPHSIKKNVPPIVTLPIYEEVKFQNHTANQNSIELESNAAYGPIQPKLISCVSACI